MARSVEAFYIKKSVGVVKGLPTHTSHMHITLPQDTRAILQPGI
jgi:hypothetical protein